MAKRRSKRRSWRKSKKIPLALTLGAASTLFTPGPAGTESIISCLSRGEFEGAMYTAREKFTGIDANGNFQGRWLIQGWTPVILGAAISIIGGRFVNKYFSRIPYVGKYIGL